MSPASLLVTVRSSLGISTAPSGAVVFRAASLSDSAEQSTVSLDELIFPATGFNLEWRDGFRALLESVAQENSVTYVVPGHPLLGDVTVGYLLELQRDGHVTVSVDVGSLTHGSFDGIANSSSAVTYIDALALVEIDAAHPFAGGSSPVHTNQQVVITNCASEPERSVVARVLRRHYQPNVDLTLQSLDGNCEPEVIPLSALEDVALGQPHLLIIPPATDDEFQRTSDDLQRLVARLRAPDGCPWDRDQTNQSLTKNLIEETYELLDAIESGDAAAMREELGDFILQAYLHCQIAEEAGRFTLEDVFATLITKLVRRHPHVFATATADDADEVVQNWDEIKRAERAEQTQNAPAQPLGNVPLSLPALLRTQGLLKRAGRSGMAVASLAKHRERALEATSTDPDSIEILSALVTTIETAGKSGLDLEQLLRDWSRALEESISAEHRNPCSQ